MVPKRASQMRLLQFCRPVQVLEQPCQPGPAQRAEGRHGEHEAEEEELIARADRMLYDAECAAGEQLRAERRG